MLMGRVEIPALLYINDSENMPRIPRDKIIVRKNGLPFVSGNKQDIAPFLKVEVAQVGMTDFPPSINIINGKWVVDSFAVEEISEEEAQRRQTLWDSIELANADILNAFYHIREDNGAVKVALAKNQWKRIVYQYTIKYGKRYAAYHCPECDEIHMGKIQ
jgi:hypothetical protein